MKKGFKGFIKVKHKFTGVTFTLEIDSYDKKLFEEIVESSVVEKEEDDIPTVMVEQSKTEEPKESETPTVGKYKVGKKAK